MPEVATSQATARRHSADGDGMTADFGTNSDCRRKIGIGFGRPDMPVVPGAQEMPAAPISRANSSIAVRGAHGLPPGA